MLVSFPRLIPRHRARLETLFDIHVYKLRGLDRVGMAVKSGDEHRFRKELSRLRIDSDCGLLTPRS